MTEYLEESHQSFKVNSNGIKNVESSIRHSEIPCPLCGSSVATPVFETPYAEIWLHLHSEWGASFSEAIKSAHTPAQVVKLQACSECQLQYFSPAVPGNDNFYSELTSSCHNYYNDYKWEFDYVKNFINRDSRILDVACGKGAFLRSISRLVSAAVGIDTNPDAASCSNEANILLIYNQSVEECSVEHGMKFDLVSAFQVIEHLGAVMPFVCAAYKCVKPGGVLVLSVPNRERRKEFGFGSFDYPPHHISRWTESQLALVAKMLNAKLVSVAKQPLNKSQTIGALRLKELPNLLPYSFPGRNFIIKVISRLILSFPLSLAWRKLDIAKRLNMYGMSVVAIIQKPITE